MIDFELSEGVQTMQKMVHAVAEQAMRPIAREYDEREHEKPWDFLNMMWQVSGREPDRRQRGEEAARGAGRAKPRHVRLDRGALLG
jgi:hypothetical protein